MSFWLGYSMGKNSRRPDTPEARKQEKEDFEMLMRMIGHGVLFALWALLVLLVWARMHGFELVYVIFLPLIPGGAMFGAMITELIRLAPPIPDDWRGLIVHGLVVLLLAVMPRVADAIYTEPESMPRVVVKGFTIIGVLLVEWLLWRWHKHHRGKRI